MFINYISNLIFYLYYFSNIYIYIYIIHKFDFEIIKKINNNIINLGLFIIKDKYVGKFSVGIHIISIRDFSIEIRCDPKYESYFRSKKIDSDV